MTDPYSTTGDRPTDTPQEQAQRGVGGRDVSLSLFFSFYPNETNRFGTFHLLTETLRTRKRVIALSDPIDSTLPKIATPNRPDKPEERLSVC